MDRQELSDAVWERMARHLPGKATAPERIGRDNRLFVEAILWLARSGAHWRVLPKEFSRCRRYANGGTGTHIDQNLIDAVV